MPDPRPPDKPALPALDRGLAILDLLIRTSGPLRFGELRAALPGVQDSTLARILKSLESYGYLERDPNAGYRITAQVRAWGPYLNATAPTLENLARREVDRLAREGEESAAIALLCETHIEVPCSRSVEDGIRILQPGDTLHFEPDHAAALAILSRLTPDQRQLHLDGSFSSFHPGETFEQSLANAQTDGPTLLDRSRARPGVCRLAQAFERDGVVGSVFFCLTEEACRRKQAQLTHLLETACQRLTG